MESNLEMTMRVKNKVRVKRKMTRKQQGILTLLKCFDGFLIDRVSRVFFIGLNPFEILSNSPEISDPMIEELEQQILSPTTGINNVEIIYSLPTGTSSSPSYADIIKNKPLEISRSSEDESIWRLYEKPPGNEHPQRNLDLENNEEGGM
jgi:hypothetical protein